MRPMTMIRGQASGIRARVDGAQGRFQGIINSILPKSLRQRLGMSTGKRRGAKGEVIDGDFAELDPKKARRLSGGQRLRVVQKQAQFSQIHLIETDTGKRQITHIGQKVDRSWSEIILPVGTGNVRFTFTLVNQSEYGSNVVITYERGDVEVLVDGDLLTHDNSLPIKNGTVIAVNGRNYVIDMFAYEALPIVTRVDTAWLTNVGPVRDDNQDAIGIYQHRDAYMFTIADGVGGGYAGDIVSEYSVKYLLKVFQKNIRYDLSWYDVFRKAFQHVNAEVRKFVETSPIAAGTTLTSVFIREWIAYIAHVGDSRVYHIRGTRIRQLTTDHREEHPIERTTKYEHIPDELLPRRDVLVKAIGKRDTIEPEIMTFALQPGDKLLMVTDGITHRVSDQELVNIVVSEHIDDIPEVMVRLANERENTDNASAIIINVMEQGFEKDIWNAVASERVFIGGKNWRLDLERPFDMNTIYPLQNQVGCLTAIVVLLLCGLLWWLPGRMNPDESANSTNSAAVIDNTLEGTVEDIVIREATQSPLTNVTVIPMPDTPTIVPTATATLVPSATITPRPSATPLPTRTLNPTTIPTLAPSATPIPPTSTLRA